MLLKMRTVVIQKFDKEDYMLLDRNMTNIQTFELKCFKYDICWIWFNTVVMFEIFFHLQQLLHLKKTTIKNVAIIAMFLFVSFANHGCIFVAEFRYSGKFGFSTEKIRMYSAGNPPDGNWIAEI